VTGSAKLCTLSGVTQDLHLDGRMDAAFNRSCHALNTAGSDAS
jgi:hypothetical protein